RGRWPFPLQHGREAYGGGRVRSRSMGTTIGHVDTLAHTSLGAIRGNEHEGTAVFKGIRYATASRFCTPEATGPWEGALDANRYGAQCHQLPGTLERLLGSGSLP